MEDINILFNNMIQSGETLVRNIREHKCDVCVSPANFHTKNGWFCCKACEHKKENKK